MKVYLEVYGCTANKSDASLILGILKEKPSQDEMEKENQSKKRNKELSFFRETVLDR